MNNDKCTHPDYTEDSTCIDHVKDTTSMKRPGTLCSDKCWDTDFLASAVDCPVCKNNTVYPGQHCCTECSKELKVCETCGKNLM